MPSTEASWGEPNDAGWPSKRTSPESYDWTPARPLISVDLPAPLSPTSALTRPGWTSMSTPLSTSTGPKLLRMSRSSMRAVMDVFLRRLLEAGLLARRLDRGRAHVGDLRVAVVEHLLHVVRVHDDGVLGDERRAVSGLLVDLRLLAGRELLGQIHGRRRLELERLVHRRELLAQEDGLQPRRGGVPAAHRHLQA